MPPADAELKLAIGSAGASPSRTVNSQMKPGKRIRPRRRQPPALLSGLPGPPAPHRPRCPGQLVADHARSLETSLVHRWLICPASTATAPVRLAAQKAAEPIAAARTRPATQSRTPLSVPRFRPGQSRAGTIRQAATPGSTLPFVRHVTNLVTPWSPYDKNKSDNQRGVAQVFEPGGAQRLRGQAYLG